MVIEPFPHSFYQTYHICTSLVCKVNMHNTVNSLIHNPDRPNLGSHVLFVISHDDTPHAAIEFLFQYPLVMISDNH